MASIVRTDSVVTPQPANTDPRSAATAAAPTPAGQQLGADSAPPRRKLEPMVLAGHIAVLQRTGRALRRSRHEAEDPVQDAFARVPMRPITVPRSGLFS